MCTESESNTDTATCYRCEDVKAFFAEKPKSTARLMHDEVESKEFASGELKRVKLSKSVDTNHFCDLFSEFLLAFMKKTITLEEAKQLQRTFLLKHFGEDPDVQSDIEHTRFWYDESVLEYDKVADALDELFDSGELNPGSLRTILDKLFDGLACRVVAILPWRDSDGEKWVMSAKATRDRDFKERYPIDA